MIPRHNCFIISEDQRTRLSNHLFTLGYMASPSYENTHKYTRGVTHIRVISLSIHYPEGVISRALMVFKWKPLEGI